MDSSNDLYFKVEDNFLGEVESNYPYHLYIYHPLSKRYTLILEANTPLINDKRMFIHEILERGGVLAISVNQKKTFLQFQAVEEEDIPSLKRPETHPLSQKHQKLKNLIQNKKSFHFDQVFKAAAESKDWMPLIVEAKINLMSLSPRVSATTTMAAQLSEKLLIEDNLINRVVALSFHLAKAMRIKDDRSLGELACAGFFCHLGMTQLDFNYSHWAHTELNGKTLKEYKKHVGLSTHLIKKFKILLSERAHKIIMEHHERFDGTGYPDRKMGRHLEFLSLILGCSAHLVEYHMGKVSGDFTPFITIVNNLKNKTLGPGLELSFGDQVYDAITTLYSDYDINQKSA